MSNEIRVKNLIRSDMYQDFLNTFASENALIICRDYPNELAILDAKKMDIAKISIDEIISVLINERLRISKFIKLKLQLSEKITREENKQNPSLQDHGYGENFVLLYCLEYILLGKGDESLLSYLNKVRIPKINKYIKCLHQIYNQLD